jgi:hypothetical protein
MPAEGGPPRTVRGVGFIRALSGMQDLIVTLFPEEFDKFYAAETIEH